MYPALLQALLLLPLPALDAPGKVDGWCASFAKDRRPTQEDLSLLKPLLIDLRGYGRLSRAHRARAARSLLDLYGTGLAASRTSGPERAVLGWSLLQLAEAEFHGLEDDELVRWATEEVLVVRSGNPVLRRAAAARLIAWNRTPEILQALKVCARDDLPGLREAALEALVGWEDEGVHGLFVQLLWKADEATPSPLLAAAESHLRSIRLTSSSSSLEVLEAYVLERIGAPPWRPASLAAAVSAALPDESGIPLLIYGMASQEAHAGEGRPVRRISSDIQRELVRRSGMDLGARAERWRTWWEASRTGAPRQEPGAGLRTTASFFGLRPRSDRLVFVLDRSGSMDQPFGTAAGAPEGARSRKPRTRHDEAIRQMIRYLEALGAEARFNLVLFADGPKIWRKDLQPATPAQLKAVEAWARRHPPKGSTRLRTGVELALGMSSEGTVDVEELEADTLVVLCDGRTDEGEGWVIPVLQRVNPRARVLVHGVQIGSRGDGTLGLLASVSGGDFVQVEE